MTEKSAPADQLVKIVSMRKAFPLADMKPYEKNPRVNDHVVEILERSLGKFGAVEPIVLDTDGRICAGHTRWKAARERGDKAFPAIVCEFADEATFAAYNVTSNRTAQHADWQLEKLQAQIDQIVAAGFEIEDIGFDDAGLKDVERQLSEAVEADEVGGVPGDEYREQYGVIVICDSESHQQETYEGLQEAGYNCKVVTT